MGTLKNGGRKRIIVASCGVLFCVGATAAVPPVLSWQRLNANRTLSLSNMRRLTIALQLYAQDYDGCIPLPAEHRSNGSWLTWPDRIKGYAALTSILDNPSNSVASGSGRIVEPLQGFRITTSYALNHRFNGQFGRGAFPLDNLELSNQTALLVEAGPMWSTSGRSGDSVTTRSNFARIEYGDTLDRYQGYVPYPSTHGGKMAVAAADGHATAVTVEHYTDADGPHDPLYGRIGGDIYNWNGGHPNGDVDRPPRE
jgi:prepilin-type processing-associated H-X9-DG protein